MMIAISIPGLTGPGDRANVEAALLALPGTRILHLDPDTRRAEVDSTAAPADLLAALGAAGYPSDIVN